MAYRSFVGSCATLVSSVVNLTVLMVLQGEPGWICLMCCNADILFSVIVLHWVTQVDRLSGNSSNQSNAVHPGSVCDNKNPNASTAMTGRDNAAGGWAGNRISVSVPAKANTGTMTTEIRAAPAVERRSDDDTFELRGIMVHTERIQEVQDSELDSRSEASANGSCRHYTAERSVTVEKMV